MLDYLKSLTTKEKLMVLALLSYSLFDSLVITNRIGFLSLVVLIFLSAIGIRNKNWYGLQFLLSLMLVIVSVGFYLLNVEGEMDAPIKKLSEWAFLFMLSGALGLLISKD